MRVSVRVRPAASRTRVGGSYGDGDQRSLVVAVTARAVDGAATEAVLVAVADAFGVRRREVDLVSGATHRTKVLEVDIDPPRGAARLAALLAV
ncbi:MAG: DUF167 domain-containing protein [Dermatophilaceae bacterium]|nr:DUF167 domain-containing protein [Actinomycetales bacterium]MBP8880659.1 DUF167 domain-containing protein [Dermatophilaceae bacterium]MBP9917859.1 DUF167 domain-containing protein [Dermatophilaceae bacterium]